MVYDAVRGYLQLAMGLTEVTKQKANDAAKAVAGQLGIQGEDALAGAGAAAGIASQQVQTLAEDLLAAARSNRKLITDLVRVEVDAVVNRLGITDPKQLDAVRATLSKLEEQLAGLVGVRRPGSEPAPDTKGSKSTSKSRSRSKSSAGDARPLVTEPAKKTAAKKTAAKKTSAKKTAAKKAPAKKTTVKKATAKKAPAKKAPAKKEAAHEIAETPVVASVTTDLASAPVPDLAPVTAAATDTATDTATERASESLRAGPDLVADEAPVIVLPAADDASLGSRPEQS